MAIDFFRVGKGLELVSEDFTSRVNVLTGTGTPGGDGFDEDSAPIGSLYMRQDIETDGLQLYYKTSLVNNSSADWAQVTDKKYIDSVAMGLSWREPARVMDQTAYANPAAFPTSGTVNGVIMSDGDRVLFTSVAAVGTSNVYIWDGVGASWSEDMNAETDGDAVLIQEGTFAEQQWVYDGTSWVQFGGAANTQELEFLRSFIGKTGAGAEMPAYSSTDVVSPTANLEQAIGQLDAAIGTQTFTNQFTVTSGQDVTGSLNALDVAVGSKVYTENNVITDGESVSASLDKVDVVLGDLQTQNLVANYTNITAVTTIDSIPVTQADVMDWRVIVEEAATPGRRTSSLFTALHDGAGGVDVARYATVRRGGNISGLAIEASVVSGDLILTVSSNVAVNVGVKRIVALAAS